MKTKSILMFMLFLLCAWSVQAAPITVLNSSFEADGILHLQDFTPTGWTWNAIGGRGVEIGGTEGGAFFWQGFGGTTTPASILYQTTGYVIPLAGEQYTLKVDVRTSWQGIPRINLYYLDGINRVLLGSASQSAINATWATVTLTATATAASVGKNLGVQLDLANLNNVWAEYDNVRLERALISPIVPADGAINVAINQDIIWSVNVPTVAFVDLYFGTQNDPNLSAIPANKKLSMAPATTTTWDTGTLAYDTVYYWRVDAYEPNETGYAKTIGPVWSFRTISTAPVITVQPVNTVATIGGSATFSVTVVSDTTPHYVWYKTTDNASNTPGDDTVIGGDTSSVTINPVAKADEGYYFCKVTNSSPTTVYSNVAMLGVKRAVAHWVLDALDGSGNYPDGSGEGHDADPNGTPVFVPGANPAVTSNGVTIDSTNGFADAGTWNPSQYTGQFTISMWVKWAGQGTTATWQGLIGKRTAFSADGMMWQVEVDANNNTLAYKNGSGNAVTTPALPIGEWECVAVTSDGTTTNFYRQGVNAASGAVVPTAGVSAAITLGATELDATGAINYNFNGALDDIQIYNYALGATEIADVYFAATGKPVCINEYASTFDFDGDCLVNLADFVTFATNWLDCGFYPATECP